MRTTWFVPTALVAAVFWMSLVYGDEVANVNPPRLGDGRRADVVGTKTPSTTEEAQRLLRQKNDPLGAARTLRFEPLNTREPAPRFKPFGWKENTEVVLGGGRGETSEANWKHGYLELVPHYWKTGESVKIGPRLRVAEFDGSTDAGFNFDGLTLQGGIAILLEHQGLSQDTQTTIWMAVGERTDNGNNPTTAAKYEVEQETTLLSWYLERRIFYFRGIVPEIDVYFAGDIDLGHKKSSSIVDTVPGSKTKGQRIPVTSGDPAESKTHTRIGAIVDLVHFGEGWKDVTPGLGFEFVASNEDSSTRFTPQFRVGLLQKHLYLNVGYTNGHNAPDSWNAGFTFAVWEF